MTYMGEAEWYQPLVNAWDGTSSMMWAMIRDYRWPTIEQVLLGFHVVVVLAILFLIYKNFELYKGASKKMMSKKGMHGIIKSKVQQSICDIVEDLRYRGVISDAVATEAYNNFGIHLKFTGLLPQKMSPSEVKKHLKANGSGLLGKREGPIPLPDAKSSHKEDMKTVLKSFGIEK